MLKKIITALVVFSTYISFAIADFSATEIIPTKASSIGTIEVQEGTGLLDKILLFIKDSIFGVLGLVAIGMFLYIGFRLVKAEGNPEEMKKAFMSLIHVIVGLFIVALSWALIKMVSGLNFDL